MREPTALRNLPDLLQTALIAAAALLASALLASAPVPAHPVSGELYYTRYSGTPNIKKVPFRFDGARLVLGSKSPVGAVGGADGDLIIGGQGDRVHKVKTDGSGVHDTVSAGGGASFHVTLDPDGGRVWTAGQPGALVEVPLRPFADGVIHQLGGDDTTITAIAFDGSGAAFYTASDYRGGGRFGVVDLTTFTTHRLLSGVEAAHAIVFDSFTCDLFLFGGNDIAQIDPLAPAMIKSSRRFRLDSQFDQGTTDGEGHLFVARNSGELIFVDYAASGLIGDISNITAVIFLDSNLDDLAPLSGPGAKPATPRAVSEASLAREEMAEPNREPVVSVSGEYPAGPPHALAALAVILLLAGLAGTVLPALGTRPNDPAGARRGGPPADPAPIGSGDEGRTAGEQPARQLGEYSALLDAVYRALARVLGDLDQRRPVAALLDDLVSASDSRSGFVGDIAPAGDGQSPRYLSNLESSPAHAPAPAFLGPDDVTDLFGDLLIGAEPVLVNNPVNGARRANGIETAPAPTTFLGLPLVETDEVIGVLGLADKAGGYDEDHVTFLGPAAALFYVLIIAARRRARRKGRHAEGEAGATAKGHTEDIAHALADRLAPPIRRIEDRVRALEAQHAGARDAAVREPLAQLQSRARRLASLCAALPGLVGAHDDQGPRKNLDLSAMVREVAAECTTRDPARRVTLRIASGVKACGDPELLRLALDNLIDNAWVAAAERENVTVEFAAAARDGKTVYSITATGRSSEGPAAEAGDRRGSGPTGIEDSAGVRLAIARHAMTRQGGRLWAAPVTEEGAAWSFTLPIDGKDGEDEGPSSWRMIPARRR